MILRILTLPSSLISLQYKLILGDSPLLVNVVYECSLIGELERKGMRSSQEPLSLETDKSEFSIKYFSVGKMVCF